MCRNKKVSRQQVLRVLFNKHQGDFMGAYFKILNVMKSNEKTTNPCYESTTGLWAFKVIDQRKMYVANQFNKLHERHFRRALLNEMDILIGMLHDKHNEVRYKINRNIENEKG